MTPSQLIDKQIASVLGWRGELMSKLRVLIHEVDPNITEEWKWEVGVYTHNGMVCAISAFKNHVKINFFNGALLKDKYALLNGGLDSKKHRSIDFNEESKLKEKEVQDLIKEAVNLNTKE